VTSDPIATPGLAGGVDQTGATPVPARDPQREQVKKLAQEFEAMLMTQMLREMRRSMLSDDDDPGGGLGRDTMTDTIDVELGQALSRVGGFGLSSMMQKAIERGVGLSRPSPIGPGQAAAGQVGPLQGAPLQLDPAQTSPQPSAGPAPLALQPPASAPVDPAAGKGALKIPDGQVTSAYGWRRDPFMGAPRFHKGIDVAAVYGQDVPAAGAGRVVFAGDRGTYGTTVVLEHPSGQQTLYAHLMAAGVKAGDEVGAGQVIGRTGDSGRATGPHLHFEVVEAGHTIDPAHH
jgi:murein DD-endopeptidase MepM/ murein hydrolase activator NlpD